MTITLNGGSSDYHMMSLNDMKKIADSIQKISYNFEYQEFKTKNQEIYIKANKEGSFEILLGLIDPINFQTVAEGVAGAFLYDLIKKMQSYIKSVEYKNTIKLLVDETFKLALELAEEEYYDVRFKKKKQIIEENIKKINSEFSNYNSMKQISSIIANEDSKSLKPTSITFSSQKENKIEVFEVNSSTKEIFEVNEDKQIKVENIIISGVPDGLSRSSKSFNMEVAFIGKIKVRATDKELSKVSDYFKEQKTLKIEVEPIIKMGELVETRDGKLISIIEE